MIGLQGWEEEGICEGKRWTRGGGIPVCTGTMSIADAGFWGDSFRRAKGANYQSERGACLATSMSSLLGFVDITVEKLFCVWQKPSAVNRVRGFSRKSALWYECGLYVHFRGKQGNRQSLNGKQPLHCLLRRQKIRLIDVCIRYYTNSCLLGLCASLGRRWSEASLLKHRTCSQHRKQPTACKQAGA